jgi:hypothetical protein
MSGFFNLGRLVTKAIKSIPRSKKVSPTIKSVKPGSGKIPSHVVVGKNLKDRARIVKTNQRVKTIDKISDAEKKIKEGTKELKKLRETGHTKPIGVGKTKKYFPR